MSNTITIKHGGQAPKAGQLANFELGYCTGDGKLYFNTGKGIKNILFLTDIESGFTLNNNQSINSKLSDDSDYSLIFRSSTNNTWVGGRIDNNPVIGNLYLAVGKGTGGNGEENAYVFRMSKNAQSAANGSSLIYDETSIKNGFRINNGAEITTFLSDGATEVSLIKRSNDNIWIGQRGVTSQGDAYIGVGGSTSTAGRLYIARGQDYSSPTDYSDIYMVYDELSIGDGFTIKNNIAIKTKLADETLCTTFYRSKNNHLWLGGSDSTSSNESVGRVNLVVGLGKEKNDASQNFAYVYRKDLQASSKILDYGYIVKAIWSGSCAVGGTFSIPNYEDYRLFLFFLADSNTVLLVTRRGTYLRGGTTYANGGIYFETIRCNGTTSGTFTYTEGRSYTLTTSGATSNWGTTAKPAPAINTIYGVL